MYKHNRFWIFLSALVVLALVFSVFTFKSSAAQTSAPIRLQFATFNPGKGESPDIPPGFANAEVRFEAKGYGYYIVQFSGPVQDSWRQAVEANGGVILDYIPDFAVKVRMHPGAANQVARMPQVVYVGAFQPAYKLSPDLKRQGEDLYDVRLEPGANVAEVIAELNQRGIGVLGGLVQDGQG